MASQSSRAYLYALSKALPDRTIRDNDQVMEWADEKTYVRLLLRPCDIIDPGTTSGNLSPTILRRPSRLWRAGVREARVQEPRNTDRDANHRGESHLTNVDHPDTADGLRRDDRIRTPIDCYAL